MWRTNPKHFGKPSFANPQKSNLDAGLSAILGVRQPSREWDLLNKGVHEEEDRGEFDQGLVRNIVEALEVLDRAIEAYRQPIVQNDSHSAIGKPSQMPIEEPSTV